MADGGPGKLRRVGKPKPDRVPSVAVDLFMSNLPDAEPQLRSMAEFCTEVGLWARWAVVRRAYLPDDHPAFAAIYNAQVVMQIALSTMMGAADREDDYSIRHRAWLTKSATSYMETRVASLQANIVGRLYWLAIAPPPPTYNPRFDEAADDAVAEAIKLIKTKGPRRIFYGAVIVAKALGLWTGKVNNVAAGAFKRSWKSDGHLEFGPDHPLVDRRDKRVQALVRVQSDVRAK